MNDIFICASSFDFIWLGEGSNLIFILPLSVGVDKGEALEPWIRQTETPINDITTIIKGISGLMRNANFV